jgi:hypothetical protein
MDVPWFQANTIVSHVELFLEGASQESQVDYKPSRTWDIAFSTRGYYGCYTNWDARWY